MHRNYAAQTTAIAVLAALVFTFGATASEYTIRMKFDAEKGKVYFKPNKLKIKLGDTVTWIQDDKANEHNVVAYPNGIPKGTNFFQSPMMKKVGSHWSMTFTKRGTYKYHCHPHEALGMKGVIVVDRESRADEFRKVQPGEHIHAAHGHHSGGHAAAPPHRKKGHSGHDHGQAKGDSGHGGHTASMVKGTSPIDGAQLKTSPKEIVVSFIHPMRLTVLKVTTIAGEMIPLTLGKATLSSRNAIAIPLLDPEDYTVEWRAIGSDGHAMSGSFEFTVE